MATPSTPIQQSLDDLAALKAATAAATCTPTEPLVKYGDTGNAPTLDYNIPQSTAFATYGRLVKYIDPTWFKDFTKLVPKNNFFDMVAAMSSQEVTQIFHPNVAVAAAPRLFSPLSFGTPTERSYHVATTSEGADGITPGGSETTSYTFPAARLAYAGGPIESLRRDTAVRLDAYETMPAPAPAPTSPLVEYAKRGIRPLYEFRIMNQAPRIRYVGKPARPVPRITVIEEYTTESFLGAYGAGRVVKTFSLLPGEKTQISMRTYEDKSSTSSTSHNMLDSFSESSATELDTLMQKEQGASDSASNSDGGAFSNFNTYSDTQNSSSAFSISGGLDFGIGSIGGGYSRSDSDSSTDAGGMSNAYNYSNSSVRASHINTLNNAINKHVQQSNANRQVSVNNSTTDTASSGEEDTTVRELYNPNLSRVINFVFRQLLQQYTTITYLSNLKFAYSNGYQESYKVVDLSNLPNMLTDLINPGSDTGGKYIDQVMCLLLSPYLNVMDYKDNTKQFVEAITLPYAVPPNMAAFFPGCTPKPDVLWRKAKLLTDNYTDDVLNVDVPGVILSVTQQTLQTPSVITEALLGTAEALDCFNLKSQDAAAVNNYIGNLSNMQQLEASIQQTANDQADAALQQQVVAQQIATVNSIPAPADKATLYKKVFGDCCDVAQSCGCGCGGEAGTH